MIHFLSDVHLSPRYPGVTRLFLQYLSGIARQASALYILGDLFETWIGDDDDDAHSREMLGALHDATGKGLHISIQHGNRDFLLGQEFARATGCTLLPDPFLLDCAGQHFVLSHGDALCSDDEGYQSFRRQVRTSQWKKDFLARPLADRRALANGLREQSETSKQCKTQALMDLNPSATITLIREHGYATFIHGHTHRPATHQHSVDDRVVERWVLSDWREDSGEILSWDGTTLHRVRITAPQNPAAASAGEHTPGLAPNCPDNSGSGRDLHKSTC